jgi:F-type H+-transporting ATPase subunit delta
MQETTVARSYAEALFELALGDDAPELYMERLGQIADLVETDREFRLFLETPRIEAAVKKRAIREALADRVPEKLLRFLLVVIDKRRTRALPEMAEAFSALVNEHFGRLKAEITTAVEPDPELKAEVERRLGRVLGKEILPRFRIDPRIIGGVIVKVGDRIMDGSIRRRLRMLRRSLLRAEMV